MKDEPVIARARGERRRFRRIPVDIAGRLFTPGDGQEARCTVVDLSPGGAAIICDICPPQGTQVILYVDGFGRFEGAVTRRDGEGFGVRFACTNSKRERTAEQLTLFLNKTLVDHGALRRRELAPQKGFDKFTMANGQIVPCEVMDIAVGGCSLKTEVKPMLGEYVLIAQKAGRVTGHHEKGVAIEFVGEPPKSKTAGRLNLVR